MDKQIFKVGDRVFDIMYGWGKVENLVKKDNGEIVLVYVKFDNFNESLTYTYDGRFSIKDLHPRLSFTEYTLQGFSQKRFFDYKNCIGKWGKFWDDRIKEYIISRLERITPDGFKSNTSIMIYNNFEPLTEEQIKMLNLE